LRAGDEADADEDSSESQTKEAAETPVAAGSAAAGELSAASAGPAAGDAAAEGAGEVASDGRPVPRAAEPAPLAADPAPAVAGLESASFELPSLAAAAEPGGGAAAGAADAAVDVVLADPAAESRAWPTLSAGRPGTPLAVAPSGRSWPLAFAAAVSAGWSLAAAGSVAASSRREVMTEGEAPAEPSDVFARLSKPSSYDLTFTRLSLDMTPI
jgi:hypothetical protein